MANPNTNTNSNGDTWTKELVQDHAKTAVLIEMYTLPFYLTVMTSIVLPEENDSSDKATFTRNVYNAILSVCIEEMLHLQLAANLCLALDVPASDIFQKPKYGQPIPYLEPYDPDTMGSKMPNHIALLNAKLGPLNKGTLNTMLDIETPTEFDESLDHTTPQYPYATIGQMYDALLQGILEVEANKPVFSWSTQNQQEQFTLPPDYQKNALRINQKISSFGDAQQAVNLICGQGEGLTMIPVPTAPYTEAQFPVKVAYRFYPKDNPEEDDPFSLNQYTHYGRFLWIQNQIENHIQDWPDTYPVSQSSFAVKSTALNNLTQEFDSFLNILTSMWSGGSDSNFFEEMYKLKPLPTSCWEAGIVPQWSNYDSNIDFKPTTDNLDYNLGQSWMTSTGYTFIFQYDGNLVLYNSSGEAIWASGTNNKNAHGFSVQADGNVCIYTKDGTCIWDTGTSPGKGNYLSIQTDGNVVIYTRDNQPIWATNTEGK